MTNQATAKIPFTAIVRDNAKMAALYALGAWLVFPLWPPLGWIYLAYCVLSLLLFVRLICPYCFRYHAGTCLSGYHIFAGLFKPQSPGKFTAQFKRYIGVLFPVWFVPPLVGGYRLIAGMLAGASFLWGVFAQLALFCLVGFVILPYISGQHSCKTCENAENCPWRKGK